MSKKIEPTAVAVSKPAELPAIRSASPELLARLAEVKDNMESIEEFRLPRVKMTSDGFQLIEGEAPLKEIEGVIIHTRKVNMYYEKPYNRNEISPPDCYSMDGLLPDARVVKPMAKACKGCPKAEYGTNSMKSGKACRNLKPLYILLGDEAIMPRQLVVTPTSLKAANQYLMDLTERGFSYRKVVTKIQCFKKDPQDKFVALKFSMGRKLNDQQIADAAAIRAGCQDAMDIQAIDVNEVDNSSQPPVEMSHEQYSL